MRALYFSTLGDIEHAIQEAAKVCLRNTFRLEIKNADTVPIPDGAYDQQRKQYSSAHILIGAARSIPRDAVRYLILTDKDLFIPMLSFVYGHAQVDGQLAIVSIARLRQEYYGFPQNEQLLISRTMKEIVHEIGHTFGLTHCSDRTCPMSLSTNIKHIDAKGIEFCKGCKIILLEAMESILHR